MSDLPTTRTNSRGEIEVIADMHFAHLISAHAKAIRTEERKHENAVLTGEDYDNPQAELEIQAMAAEIERRNAARAFEDDPRE